MLAHPLVAVPLWVVVYYGWHIPVLYDAAVRHDVVHALEHATMFGAGLALWVGLLGPAPQARLVRQRRRARLRDRRCGSRAR